MRPAAFVCRSVSEPNYDFDRTVGIAFAYANLFIPHIGCA